MIGERLTDGETEATLKYLLDKNEQPALYVGKSWEQLTTVEVSVPLDDVRVNPNILNSYKTMIFY